MPYVFFDNADQLFRDGNIPLLLESRELGCRWDRVAPCKEGMCELSRGPTMSFHGVGDLRRQ